MRCDGLCAGQRKVHKQFPQKEKGARLSLQDQCVFTAPPLTTSNRQLGFHDRRRISKHSVAKGADQFGHAMLKFLQSAAHDLVIVPPSGIHRNHALRGLIQGQAFRLRRQLRQIARQIIHLNRDHTEGSRQQFCRPGTF